MHVLTINICTLSLKLPSHPCIPPLYVIAEHQEGFRVLYSSFLVAIQAIHLELEESDSFIYFIIYCDPLLLKKKKKGTNIAGQSSFSFT